ncbi:MAG: type II CRISPR RNA-guided endonuclease Cas9, partial [bacterium]
TRLKQEFPSKNDENIYTSCLLRIALLQNKQLEEWQIYKALYSAIQRRGYDNSLPWMNSKKAIKQADDEENEKFVNEYVSLLKEMIPNENYHLPCYLDASLMGLWNYTKPTDFELRINHNAQPVRVGGRVAPRNIVEKELKLLFENAKKQLSKLSSINTEEFLYGEGQEAYSSYKNIAYSKFRGKEWDSQGVLSQKIPRFDNRIISKCQLMPLRNVCKADSNICTDVKILMALKNFRYVDIKGERKALTAKEIKKLFEEKKNYIRDKKKLNKTDIKKFLKENSIIISPNNEINEIKVNVSGRARFCMPALKIIKEIILSGISPLNFDYANHIKNVDDNNPEKGVTKTEIENILKRLGDSWENIHIGDNRDELLEKAINNPEQEVLKTIGSVPNPVVRHRLQWFYNELKNLSNAHGKPQEIIIEFIRDGEKNSLLGKKKIEEYQRTINENEKNNKELVKKLETYNISIKQGLERLKLLEIQEGKCIYTGTPIQISEILDCEIDHIVPVSENGNDALYNKVLCIKKANQDKKGRTPFSWFKSEKTEEEWHDYILRISKLKRLGNKKAELLIKENPHELIESYNGLAETAYIARIAQKIVALHFGWGLQTKDESRKIFVSNGSETAKLRKIYKLNSLLYSEDTDIKNIKNRSNPKHHALDALCISYSRELKPKKQDNGKYVWHVEGLNPENIKTELNKLIPYTVKRNFEEITLKETFYAKKLFVENGEKIYKLTVKKNLKEEILSKKTNKDRINFIKSIVDEQLKEILLQKLIENPNSEELQEFLNKLKHPKRNSLVKRVLLVPQNLDKCKEIDIQIDKKSCKRERIGKFLDLGNKDTKGQFKASKQHQGQIIYFDEKGKPKVIPIYSHLSLKKTTQQIKNKNLELYKKGKMFYSGCLINIPEDFKDSKGNIKKAWKYELKTIKSNGQVELKSLDGEPISTSVINLIVANFDLFELKQNKKIKV